jgi:hypothetical protein
MTRKNVPNKTSLQAASSPPRTATRAILDKTPLRAASSPPRATRTGLLCTLSVMLALFMLTFAWLPVGGVQAAGTDEIKSYAIDVLPQADGSLVNTYDIHWCVISNSAGPLTWISLGMPAEQYQIVNSSGDVTTVRSDNQGFDYKIRIDLPRQVNAGDCVTFTVQIHQYGMANQDSTTRQISFQYTPGWFNEVPVDLLQVTWHLPSDAAQLKSLDPKPAEQNDSQAVWKSVLQPGEKYPITVVYDQAAFPDFNAAQTVATLAPDSSSSGSAPSVTDSTNPGNTSAPVSLLPFAIPAFSLSTCICGCIILIVVLIVLVGIFRLFGSAARSYRGGGFFGGYPRGGGWLGGGGGGGLGSLGRGGGSVTHRTGGGSGLFGGRGMSCACVSSGCACACAGGGRAGCSRKGFDVSGLFPGRQEK